MRKSFEVQLLFVCLILMIWITGCTSQKTSEPAASAVKGYLEALAAKNENQMINLSCAAWEAQAKVEFNSFSAVDLTLENLDCRETGAEGSYTLVACTGTMVANYGVEDLEIDVADRIYKAIEEGGDWRMCGYK